MTRTEKKRLGLNSRDREQLNKLLPKHLLICLKIHNLLNFKRRRKLPPLVCHTNNAALDLILLYWKKLQKTAQLGIYS